MTLKSKYTEPHEASQESPDDLLELALFSYGHLATGIGMGRMSANYWGYQAHKPVGTG